MTYSEVVAAWTADRKRIKELEAKVRERGHLIATHMEVDELEASWDRIIVAECKREWGDEE
jgi:hypothetical protein